MVGKLKLGKINLTFVFRHRWDDNDKIKYNPEFSDYRIGFWFKIKKIVGSKNFNDPNKWKDNYVNDYMIGINLIICKMWVSFNRGGMSL